MFLTKPPNTQDCSCDAWFQLLELIDQAAEDKRAVFNPSKDLGGEVWSQITVLPKTIAKLKFVEIFKYFKYREKNPVIFENYIRKNASDLKSIHQTTFC